MSPELKNVSETYDWVGRVLKRYQETGRFIPERQEKLYHAISLEFCGGKTVLDVGCSLGFGSNILSHEARAVWGVDINPKAIDFAVKAFKRPNLDFAVLDIENPPTRELAKFEIVTMIETLEHVEKPDIVLQNLQRFFTHETIGFITLPNFANEEVKVNEAKHGLHLSHLNAGEFYSLMIKHFQSVVMFDADKIGSWTKEETVDGDSQAYLVVAKCENPI